MEASSSILKLIVEKGPRMGETLEFNQGTSVRIGRIVRGNTFPIKDSGVSSKHLAIEYKSGKWVVTDLDSSNGTFLNSSQLHPLTPFDIRDGDEIKIGEITSIRVKFIFASDDAQLRRNPRRVCSMRNQSSEVDLSRVKHEPDFGGPNLADSGLGSNDGKCRIGDEDDEDMEHVSKPKTRRVARARPKRGSALEERNAEGLREIRENVKTLEIHENSQNVQHSEFPASTDNGGVLKFSVNLGNAGDLRTSGHLEGVGNLQNAEKLGSKQLRETSQRRNRSSKKQNVTVPSEGIINPGVVEAKPAGRMNTRRTRSMKTEDSSVKSSSVLEKISEDSAVAADRIDGQEKVGPVEKNKPRGGRGRKRNMQGNSLQNVVSEETNYKEDSNVGELIANELVDNAIQKNKRTVGELLGQESCGVSEVGAVQDDKIVEESNVGEASGNNADDAHRVGEEIEAANGPDIENTTLGKWFEFLEVYLPKQIHSVTDEIIADMRRRACEFRDFLLQQQKREGQIANRLAGQKL